MNLINLMALRVQHSDRDMNRMCADADWMVIARLLPQHTAHASKKKKQQKIVFVLRRYLRNVNCEEKQQQHNELHTSLLSDDWWVFEEFEMLHRISNFLFVNRYHYLLYPKRAIPMISSAKICFDHFYIHFISDPEAKPRTQFMQLSNIPFEFQFQLNWIVSFWEFAKKFDLMGCIT